MICIHCQKPMAAKARFCMYCGALAADSAAGQTPGVPAEGLGDNPPAGGGPSELTGTMPRTGPEPTGGMTPPLQDQIFYTPLPPPVVRPDLTPPMWYDDPTPLTPTPNMIPGFTPPVPLEPAGGMTPPLQVQTPYAPPPPPDPGDTGDAVPYNIQPPTLPPPELSTLNSQLSTQVLSAAHLTGILLLFCLPLVNFVLACVWAFSRNEKRLQRRNLARAALIVIMIGWVFLMAAAWWLIAFRWPLVQAVWELLT